MSGTLYDAKRMFAQISLSSKIYIYIYTTLYVEYVSYIYTHTIIDHNYGRGVQRSECPLGHDTCNKFWYVWEECKHCL